MDKLMKYMDIDIDEILKENKELKERIKKLESTDILVGMKAVCIGEFEESCEFQCPDCKDLDEDEHSEACEICHGTRDYIQPILVQWTTTKDIYDLMHKTKVDILNSDS